MNKVEEYYDRNAAFEDKRQLENDFELPVTLKFIRRYVKPGQKILDLACGTGRYASILLDNGYLMRLNDLSQKNIDLTMKKTGDHSGIIHVAVSDALDSDIWKKENWDAVLILGPLYHLPEKQDRLKILMNAKRSVKKGGVIFSAFSDCECPRFSSGQALIPNISFAELTANWRFGSDPATLLY